MKRLISKRVGVAAKYDDIVPYEYTEQMASRLEADFYLPDEGKHFLDRDGYLDFHLVEVELNKMLDFSI